MRVLLAGLVSLAVVAGLVGLLVHRGGHHAPAEAASSPSCAPVQPNVSQALAGARVTVSPAPQSRDASAVTQISMLGVPADELSDVTITGSRSGAHPGRLAAYSQGDGASFLPAPAFGKASWSASTRSCADGHATEHPFVVELPRRRRATGAGSASTAARRGPAATRRRPRRAPAPRTYQSFRSRPDLRPPTVTVSAQAGPRPARCSWPRTPGTASTAR